MIKIRTNILFFYTLFIFLAVMFVAFFLGIFLSRSIKNFLISIHVETFPEMVQLNLIHHEEVFFLLDDFAPQPGNHEEDSHHGEGAGQDSYEIFRNFLTLSSVKRVKVFNSGGTIVWSDNKEAIGKNYKDNERFKKALSGTVSYSFGYLNDKEHETDNIKTEVLEIYVPVEHEGRVMGVIELYEQSETMINRIHNNVLIVQVTIAAAGLILYVMLFFLFFRSYKNQKKSKEHIEKAQDVIIFALGYQAELRDKETGRHLDRTSLYVKLLTEELAENKRYSSYIGSTYISDLIKSSPLHDIGKIVVPDSILRKPGKLTTEEFEIMKKHCLCGYDILKKSKDKLPFRSFLDIAMTIALYHHEKWDGTGYPKGLAGYDIPLSARIMALADVYDALRSKRYYKESFPHEECYKIICESRGTHFDPELVDAFIKREKEFERISLELAD